MSKVLKRAAMAAVLVLVGSAAVADPSPPAANAVIWGINSSSCTPDNTAIQSNLYLNSAGSTGFASGKTGDVVMYCPVPQLSSNPGNMQIGYIDDTASSADHVEAQLIAMDYTTGSISTLSSISSASFASSTTYVTHMLATDFTGYDAADNAYYIRIDLVRAGTQHETMFNIILLGP